VEVPPHALTAGDDKVDDGGMTEVNTQEEVKEEEGNEIVTATRCGRSVGVPTYLRENYESCNIGLSAAEENYYAAMASMEFGFVLCWRCGGNDGWCRCRAWICQNQ
jgi:hypothetical protein